MWKAVVGHNVSVKMEAQGDDWDTDPDFVVSVWCGNCYTGGAKSPWPWALAAELGWGSGLGTACSTAGRAGSTEFHQPLAGTVRSPV